MVDYKNLIELLEMNTRFLQLILVFETEAKMAF